MGDVPTWVWQVVAAIVGGLGLGVGLGGFWQRGKKRTARPGTAAAANGGPNPGPSTQPLDNAPAAAPKPVRPASDNTPQQRLLERLRENNLQLSAQLRSAAEEHARALQDRTQEMQAERFRQERQIEELRQAHSAELSHLMSVLVEQVDTLHKDHAEQLRLMEAEIERLRREPGDGVPTTPAALDAGRPSAPRAGPAVSRPPPEHAATEIQTLDFVPTQLMDPARQP